MTKKADHSELGKKALALHKKLRGKFTTGSKFLIKNKHDLSLVYTPGVGAVSSFVAAHAELARDYTMKGNTIAVISDGSAVLGLGNIGPEGALPVMEGKCQLFKEFAGIDAVPLVLATQDTEEIIKTIKAISPGFGGINLEDISAPRCFEIEERLKHELQIPVMHDDQHGTAIIVFAGLLNALKVVGKKLNTVKIVISGAGAAGTAIASILVAAGAEYVLVADRVGILYTERTGISPEKRKLAELTNKTSEGGTLEEALNEADVFIGVSGPGIINARMIQSMSEKAIVFALANPTPEIMPDIAAKAGAAVVATGRSDFPNQLNNALVFPGVFHGALHNRVTHITQKMKLQAAHAIAKLIPRPTAQKIIPDIFDKRLVKAISKVIR